jgi:hypothetical protein
MSYYKRFPDPGDCVTRQQVIDLANLSGRVAERMRVQDNSVVHPYYKFRERRLTEASMAAETLRSCGDIYTRRISRVDPEHRRVQPLYSTCGGSSNGVYTPWNNQDARNVGTGPQGACPVPIPWRPLKE